MNLFSKVFPALCATLFSIGIAVAQIGTTAQAPKIGDAPPPLTIDRMVQGPAVETVTWEKLKGKVVVLEFWNIACVPCVRAIPHLNELVEQFGQKPVVFLCLSDDNEDHLRNFLKRTPVKGWLALDGAFKPTTTAFNVTGIPHTVIVDATGKIAAITHPALLKAGHLNEILAGKPSTLPAPKSVPVADAPVVPLSNSVPATVEVSINGPFLQPHGAFGHRGWEPSNCVYQARKAFPLDALAGFFRISPKLIFETAKLPVGLYDLSASGPPGQIAEVQKQLIETVKAQWGIQVEPTTRDMDVYAVTVCATNAPGLKAVQKRGGGGGRAGGFTLGGQEMKVIVSYLEGSLDKPVVDETGLPGLWAADLKWEMSEQELASDADPDPAKVIKAAREQLGLEIKPVRRTLLVLEIRAPK
jgi:uncharacterized protein (TIGR03435 family)